MSGRRYERGNRTKHLGLSELPVVDVDPVTGERIGRCPSGMAESYRKNLLDGAIAHIIAEPYSLESPKRLYVVDSDGTIYTAQTTNPRDSYHGYPYAGRMGKRLIAALRKQAVQKDCEPAFDRWLSRWVTVGGPPDL